MPSTQAGLIYAMNRAYAPPGQLYYVILTESLMSIDSNLATAVAGELTGGGYTRIPVSFGDASITSDGFVEILSTIAQFAASGGDIGPFQCLVITDAASGDEGTVIAFYNYSVPQIIENGSVLSIQYPIKYITQ